jgi:hypothetical protein
MRALSIVSVESYGTGFSIGFLERNEPTRGAEALLPQSIGAYAEKDRFFIVQESVGRLRPRRAVTRGNEETGLSLGDEIG